MRILGYTPGQWISLVLIVFVALVLLQLFADGLRKFGGGVGRSTAATIENLSGTR